jgi:lipoate-protein ligase A
MAVDETLAESVRAGGLPFLRFYTWAPATLSLGRFQHPKAGLTARATSVPRVRRSTGGGAIWHAEELTYSLGCHQDDLPVKGVKASFERLSGFLLDAWRSQGWDSSFARDAIDARPLGGYTPSCFAGTEEYDILVNGRKLGGNAQRRDRTTIFQHGSVPVRIDHHALADLFLPGHGPLPQTIIDLETCGWTGTPQDLTALLSRAFQERLGVEWEEVPMTAAEGERAQGLVAARFGAFSWTEGGEGSLRAP